MSKRRWSSERRLSSEDVVDLASSEEEEEAPPPRAARRAALQHSQGDAGGSRGPPVNPLAVLLAGSRANGGNGGAGRPPTRGAGAAGKPPLASKPRAQRATRPPAPAPALGAPSSQRGAGDVALAGQLWVEKHAPASEAELAVHKKKVQEVREWLEEQRRTLGQPGVPRLLVVSGPPGCGKNTTLRVLARALGFDVSEWRPPTAVLYEEAQYAGMQRRSKLDEFGEFVARTKLPHLSLHSTSAGASSGSGAAPSATPAAPAGSQQHTVASQAAAAAAARLPGRLPPSLLPTLVLVDDLPHAAGPEQRMQIAEALGDLAAGARFPVVLLATETSGKAQQERGLSAAAGTYQGLHKELLAVLEARRAATISFNPFTPTNTAKALHAILAQERRTLPDADVAAIAEQSGGDMHNAISTLQFVCTGAAAAAPAAAARGRGRGTKRKAAAGGAAPAAGGKGSSSGAGEPGVGYALRDSSLSLFHALGKLLYNKRRDGGADGSQQPGGSGQQGQPGSSGASLASQQQQQPSDGGSGASTQQPWAAQGFWQAPIAAAATSAAPVPLAAWAQRRPMEFCPEAVLAASGLDAGSVSAFLHENILNFIEEGAMEDVAGCLEQLSAADCLAAGRRWGTGDEQMGDEPSSSATLLDALAASTAARGVCFCNAHPAPRRWLPLKAPASFAVGRGVAANRAELSRHTAAAWTLAGGLGSLEPAGRLAAELLPFARALAARCGNPPALQRLQPARWTRFWEGQLYQQSGGGAAAAGGGWQAGEGVEEEGVVGAPPPEDAIEESEDEDDW